MNIEIRSNLNTKQAFFKSYISKNKLGNVRISLKYAFFKLLLGVSPS